MRASRARVAGVEKTGDDSRSAVRGLEGAEHDVVRLDRQQRALGRQQRCGARSDSPQTDLRVTRRAGIAAGTAAGEERQVGLERSEALRAGSGDDRAGGLRARA